MFWLIDCSLSLEVVNGVWCCEPFDRALIGASRAHGCSSRNATSRSRPTRLPYPSPPHHNRSHEHLRTGKTPLLWRLLCKMSRVRHSPFPNLIFTRGLHSPCTHVWRIHLYDLFFDLQPRIIIVVAAERVRMGRTRKSVANNCRAREAPRPQHLAGIISTDVAYPPSITSQPFGFLD